MGKVVRVFKSFAEAEAADREYYRSLTPEQRMKLFSEFQQIYRDPSLSYEDVIAFITERSADG